VETPQLEEDEWEYCNYDRPEVMATLKLAVKLKTTLTTIEHEIEHNLTKADDPKTKFLTGCDVLKYWCGQST